MGRFRQANEPNLGNQEKGACLQPFEAQFSARNRQAKAPAPHAGHPPAVPPEQSADQGDGEFLLGGGRGSASTDSCRSVVLLLAACTNGRPGRCRSNLTPN